MAMAGDRFVYEAEGQVGGLGGGLGGGCHGVPQDGPVMVRDQITEYAGVVLGESVGAVCQNKAVWVYHQVIVRGLGRHIPLVCGLVDDFVMRYWRFPRPGPASPALYFFFVPPFRI